jgi:type IV secretion system protein VirB10
MSEESPFERRHVGVSGPHVARIALAAASALALGLGAWWLTGTGEPAPPERVPPPRLMPDGPDRLPDYGDLAAEPPAPSPAPRPLPAPPAPAAAPEPTPRPARDALRERALDAGVGGWTRERGEAEALAASVQAAGGQGSECRVSAGTPIHAVLVGRVVGEQRGTLVARTVRDVWGDGFDCLAVPAGSTVTMDYAPAAARGQKRIEVANPHLVRPWPRNDAVALDAAGTDGEGAAGLPGTISVPWAATGLLVAASTAVELGTAALAGGGLLGAILGREAESPLERAARAALDRAPVVTIEPGAPVALLLRAPLATDDFRAGR